MSRPTPGPGDEIVDLIDLEDRVIGQAPRREVRRRNLLHRGVGILCRNSRGEIYVHRRTRTKDVFPGQYDMFVGGVVGRGEAYRDAASREVAEELGVVGAELVRLFDHTYIGPDNRARVEVFSVVWDGPIRHQAEEVEWGAWMATVEIEERIREWPFVPDGLEIWIELQRRCPEEAPGGPRPR